ncbi:MAG TPA: sulfite exporter TauE/SafE family protein [Polyangia bacterium]|nr:sulfite exporter TauE/SafE family protein [Polyangia bacterium]
MLAAKPILFVLLGAAGVAFLALWIRQARGRPERGRPSPLQIGIGALTNFFDTLGIGSFATTTSLYKLGGLVADENIPGTLNVGHMIPTFAEAFIFIQIVKVDMSTLTLMIAASVAGAWLGAGVVSRWPRRNVQLGMGVLLLAAAAIMVARATGLSPGGGEALGLSGARLAAAIAGNFVLGALMTLGIGLFAPCMILVALLGMRETTAFPIMMGSCAFLMPAASVRFVRSGRYDLPASIGLAVGGLPAVLAAAYWVKSLPLEAVKWLVVAVVVYTAVAMLRSALKRGDAAGPGHG